MSLRSCEVGPKQGYDETQYILQENSDSSFLKKLLLLLNKSESGFT
jgi:hypothetical protein